MPLTEEEQYQKGVDYAKRMRQHQADVGGTELQTSDINQKMTAYVERKLEQDKSWTVCPLYLWSHSLEIYDFSVISVSVCKLKRTMYLKAVQNTQI